MMRIYLSFSDIFNKVPHNITFTDLVYFVIAVLFFISLKINSFVLLYLKTRLILFFSLFPGALSFSHSDCVRNQLITYFTSE